MSHDPQSPTDAAYMEPDEPDAVCGACGAFMDAFEISVEAFEVTGAILCDACAADAMDDLVEATEASMDDADGQSR